MDSNSLAFCSHFCDNCKKNKGRVLITFFWTGYCLLNWCNTKDLGSIQGVLKTLVLLGSIVFIIIERLSEHVDISKKIH